MIKSRLYWRVMRYFGGLLIMLTAMTLVTLYVLSQIEKNFNLAASDTKVLTNLERLRHYLTDVPQAAEEYMYTGDAGAKAVYATGWKEFDGVVSTVQSDAIDTATIHSLDKVRNNFFDWMAKTGDKKVEMRDDIVAGKDVQNELRELSQKESQEQLIPNAQSIVRDIYAQKIASQPRSIEEAKTLSGQLGLYIGMLNILFAAFTVILGLFLTRSITNPIQLLKDGTQAIMAGKFEPITLDRTDELGQLAQDFNKMSAMLGNNYTTLNAYSELVTALNTHENIDDVEDKSLELLCHHANAAIGAMYLLHEESNSLHLVTGFALKGAGESVKAFTMGEGIPGQCASERRVMEVSDVAMASSFVVDTGLVEVIPQHVLAVPIFFQERLLGVLVLGAMHKFDELHKEIINNSVPQIGVALTNARNYEASQKLSHEVAVKNNELNSKNAELEKAYRVKSDFLASMSHELRTPLNSIIGFSSVLLGPTGDPLSEDQRKALEKVLRNGKHLLQLINDVLDFSKLESGRMSVNIETDEVSNVVSSSLMTVESLIRQKGLELKQTIESDLPLLKTDILKIKQILVNLLSNATKFTEEGEVAITIGKVANSKMISFAVKDSGIGIEQKNFEKVFEEFQQIDSSNTRKYKGTGLGLPISRRLARILGGDLTVASDFGHGSTFTLVIPFEFPEENVANVDILHIPSSTPSIHKKPQPPQPQTAAPEEKKPPTPAPNQTGIKVLCIDDDPDVIEILRQYLVPEGYSVTEALSGDEGIKLAAQLKPSLITLDIMMPQKDGWQVLRELKHNEATKDIPVVIHSIIENKPLAVSLGAVDVIPKPAEPKRLLSLVQKAVNSSEQFVLIVDDNEDFTLAIKRLLEAEGFSVQIANSGQKAVDILNTSIPAIIFLDLVMPEMDGFQVVQMLQQSDRWRDIPVVILSGKELSDTEWTKLNAHIKQFMKKSEFSPDTISSVIKRILQKN
jgi:signal transduction histidine kinase/CheY-like chemotaxis protein/HAMP domain-containing protein